MKLYNTLTRQIEILEPLDPKQVTLYTCGPTVYDYTHIGHLRKYIMDDILKRTLKYFGHEVDHVLNITDVGHLTSDEDAGEDKLEKGAKKTGKTVWEVAQFYTEFFQKSMKLVNVEDPTTLAKATDHIAPMISLISIIIQKGFAYETDEAVYFDITKFKSYGQLSKQKIEEKMKGVRDEVYADPQKKHPADFSLWFKRVGRFKDHMMHWDSPWGDGFPGWHIECSAMAMKYLGETIDIHTGGIDHIPVHHENEIAQSEAATGKKFVNFWVHHNFLQVDNQKMSKSLGNFYTINDVMQRNIDPLSLRLLFMQTHYRQAMNFTWESAKAADEAFGRLKSIVHSLKTQKDYTNLGDVKLSKIDDYRQRFNDALANDLQTPQAIAVMWEMLKSNIPGEDKLDLLYEMDEVFGFKLSEMQEVVIDIPQEIKDLAEKRWKLKQEKKFKEADEIRISIDQKGYGTADIGNSYKITKK